MENTWEPAENLQCYGMINEFEQKYKSEQRNLPKYRKPAAGVSSISSNNFQYPQFKLFLSGFWQREFEFTLKSLLLLVN